MKNLYVYIYSERERDGSKPGVFFVMDTFTEQRQAFKCRGWTEMREERLSHMKQQEA